MKLRKICQFLVIIALAVAFTEATVFAETKVYICNVAMAGPNQGKTCVRLIHLANPSGFPDLSWFVADPLTADQMLMVGMTAMIKGKRVRMHADLQVKDPDLNVPVIEALMLMD